MTTFARFQEVGIEEIRVAGREGTEKVKLTMEHAEIGGARLSVSFYVPP